jgi:hypothetical protein
MRWPQDLNLRTVKGPWDIFIRFFPMAFLYNAILVFTNIELRLKNIKPLTDWEYIKWLGIRLALGLERPRGSLQEIFSSAEEDGTIFRAYNYLLWYYDCANLGLGVGGLLSLTAHFHLLRL